MIVFDRVGVHYEGTGTPVLHDVSLRVDEGELCLVIGHTGSGKSTLLAAINGLVPYFTGGTLSGRVTVAGRDTAHFRPRELADVVGVVGQDPLAGFVTDTVEEELAYTMEQLAVDPAAMRARLEETLDLLGLAGLRHRALRTLSGGQQQRVAIGAALTAHPRILVLDEPTSVSPWCWPSTGWNGCCPTPTGSSRCPATAPSPPGIRPRSWPGRASHHRSPSWACWPAGTRCHCPCGTPGGGPRSCGDGCPRRHRSHTGSAGPTPPRRPR